MTAYSKWFFPKYIDKSIKFSHFRIQVAEEQAKMIPCPKEDIIKYIKDFFENIGMDIEDFEIRERDLIKEPIKRGFYTNLKTEHRLQDKRDFIWMKFTKAESEKENGYIGVVATGCDINFSLKNSSGKIITALGKEWDENYVLIVLLKKIPDDLDRQRLESGIGNYLISKNVAILDYYSHNL